MTQLDTLYKMLLDGLINENTYKNMVDAYKRIPQIERERLGV